MWITASTKFNLGRMHHGLHSRIPMMMEDILAEPRIWDNNVARLLGSEIWVNCSKDGMPESAGQQIVNHLETVKTKPNKQLTRSDRKGALSQVESHRLKWISESKAKEFVPGMRTWLFDRIDK